MKKKLVIIIIAVSASLLSALAIWGIFQSRADATEEATEGSESSSEYFSRYDGGFDGTYTEGLIFSRNRETNEYMIVEYVGKQSEVTIPAEYNGCKVTVIAENAFFNSSIDG